MGGFPPFFLIFPSVLVLSFHSLPISLAFYFLSLLHQPYAPPLIIDDLPSRIPPSGHRTATGPPSQYGAVLRFLSYGKMGSRSSSRLAKLILTVWKEKKIYIRRLER